jgi:hypothetical protein
LLPAGQLDGGHIVRALFGEKTRFIGIATVVTMIFLAFVFNYFGFVLLIVIIMVLGGGLSHPPPLNDITKLDRRRVMVGVVALVIFMVSFHPAPLQSADVHDYGFEMSPETDNVTVDSGGFVEFNVTIENTGTIKNDAFLTADMNETKIAEGWNVTAIWEGEETETYNVTDAGPLTLKVGAKQTENVTVNVFVPPTATVGENVTIEFILKWFSQEFTDLGGTEKKEKTTFEEVIVRVV